jgi:uncharacterized protein YerC
MAEVWTPPAFDDISTSELVTAAYLNGLGNSLRFLKEVNYTAFVADVPVTATTVGTANQIVSSGAITYENVPHMIEFYCPALATGATQCFIIVRDATTVLGTIARYGATNEIDSVHAQFRVTPSAASHTYNIAAWNNGAATATFNAGAGGAAGNDTTDVAGFIRITRVPT